MGVELRLIRVNRLLERRQQRRPPSLDARRRLVVARERVGAVVRVGDLLLAGPVPAVLGHAVCANLSAVRMRWQLAQTTSHLAISASIRGRDIPAAIVASRNSFLKPGRWS